MERHFATSGFVMDKSHNKVLMIYHKKLGVWVIPGGHLEPNEFPHEGAKREVLEETGVEVKILDASPIAIEATEKENGLPSPLVTLCELIPEKGDKPKHLHIDFIFLALAEEEQPLKHQEEEVESVRWMTFDEVLESNTFESVKQIARQFQGGELKCVNFGSY